VQAKPKVSLFSFASPRVGNYTFGQRFREMGVAAMRLVNKGDVVPDVPGGRKHCAGVYMLSMHSMACECTRCARTSGQGSHRCLGAAVDKHRAQQLQLACFASTRLQLHQRGLATCIAAGQVYFHRKPPLSVCYKLQHSSICMHLRTALSESSYMWVQSPS
jgi:hypothetical protein